MLSLKDQLDANFLRVIDLKHFDRQETIEGAHGVIFLCPKCFAINGGEIGTHSVICWSRSAGAPEEMRPGPGRWKMDGTGLHDLTLNADIGGSGARSVQVLGSCQWHGFVDNGYAHGDIPEMKI